MTEAFVIDLAREALRTALVLSAPALLTGAVVGLVVGLLQAVTQVHDATLSFSPNWWRSSPSWACCCLG